MIRMTGMKRRRISPQDRYDPRRILYLCIPYSCSPEDGFKPSVDVQDESCHEQPTVTSDGSMKAAVLVAYRFHGPVEHVASLMLCHTRFLRGLDGGWRRVRQDVFLASFPSLRPFQPLLLPVKTMYQFM